MPAKKTERSSKSTSQDTTAAVDAFLATLDHPFKPEIELLRTIVLGLGAEVAEGIKWNAPSFRTSEDFATMHLRGKGTLGLILHFGAKARELPAGGVVVDDPTGLLKWLAKDRALVEFAGVRDIEAKRKPLEAALRQWVRYV